MSKKWYKTSPSTMLSIVAVLISIITMYFQFFNVNHCVEYTALPPEINSEKKMIDIPIIFKNTGNQTEVIIDITLYLETKTENLENEKFTYKRISDKAESLLPIILSPNETKKISIKGDYGRYLWGILNSDNEYSPITVYDDLTLFMQIDYLTKRGGTGQENRQIAKIFFTKTEDIKYIDYNPINLLRLNLNDDREVVKFTIIPQTHQRSIKINLEDSISIKENINNLKMLKKTLGDSLYNALFPADIP